MNHKIYKITNLITNKSYIGFTRNSLNRRFSGHRKDSFKHKNTKFAHALREYPDKNNWKIELLEENIAIDSVIEKEKYYINLFDTFNNGYNSNAGGTGNVRGIRKCSEEQKKYLSEINKGKKPTAYCIQRVKESNSKRIPSEKQKLVASKIGKEIGAKFFRERKEIHRQEMIGHEYNAETWKLTNKDGTILEVKNIKKWCRENPEYKSCGFYNMLRGAIKTYKGWIKIEKITNKYSQKEFVSNG